LQAFLLFFPLRHLLAVFSVTFISSGPYAPHTPLHFLSDMASFTGPQLRKNKEDDLSHAFLYRRCKVIFTPCRGGGGERKKTQIRLVPTCKGELTNSVPIAPSQSRPTQSSVWDKTLSVVIIKTAVTVHQELKREVVACFTAYPSHLPQPAETPHCRHSQ